MIEVDNVKNEPSLREIFNFWTWQRQKRSNSAILPRFFEVDNIKNEAILRDFLQKWKIECRADGLVPMRFAIFPVHLSKLLRLPRKSDARSYEVRHLSGQNHLSKPEDLMLQNATLLRKSAPGPPKRSDEHVSCTAPATEDASLQILFKCPTPAIVCGNVTKPSRFAHFWEGAQSLAPATRNNIWTSKSRANMWWLVHFDFEMCIAPPRRALFWHLNFQKWSDNGVFVHFDFEMCLAPQRRALFRHLNFQKWSGAGMCCTFSLRNVLGATTAFTFSTSELPKVVR